MEKQIVNIFLFLGFNYYMIKSWGTRKVTVLTLIGNYFLISILIESYYEKRGWILTRTFLALFVLAVLVFALIFIFMEYIYGIYI